MDESLLAAYRATDYRVRLAGGGTASIRVGQPLPPALRPLVGAHAWGFITAWNPYSQQRSTQQNRQAQRQLLRALRERPDVLLVRAAMGAGNTGWKEASLFVVGPNTQALDELARHFGQNGYVHGCGKGASRLQLLALPGER